METLKRGAGPGLKKFIEEYEPSIHDFFVKANEKGLLIKKLSPENRIRFNKFIETSNASLRLLNNIDNLMGKENYDSIREELIKQGYDLHADGLQAASVYCHSYQVFIERFNLLINTFINMDELGLPDVAQKNLYKIIKKLSKELGGNKFLEFMNTELRNSVAHYKYYFKSDTLLLFKDFYDQNPYMAIPLVDFLKRVKELNALNEMLYRAYFVIYSNK